MGTKGRVTIKQLAALIGVSTSTISKALADSPEISDATKKKVKELAKLYKYKPNNIALSLKNQKTNTIGVIIPDMLNSFFVKAFNGMEKEAREAGYTIITCVSQEMYETELKSVEMLSNGKIDGFIIAPSKETQKKKKYDHINTAIEDDVPVVMFDRVSESVNCDKVIIDDKEAATLATQYLLGNGRTHIALVSSIRNLSVGKLRLKGYKEALKNAKVPYDKDLVVQTEVNNLEDELRMLLSTKNVQGILALDEFSLLTALRVSEERHISVPQELAVVSFASGYLANYGSSAVTMVNQNAPKIGQRAVRMLLDRIEDKIDATKTYTEIIETELITHSGS